MILCFFRSIKFKDSHSSANKEHFRIKFLTQQLKFYNSDPTFFDYFSQVIEQLNHGEKTMHFMNKVYITLKLGLKYQIILNSSLSYSSKTSIQKAGFLLLKDNLKEYKKNSKRIVFPKEILSKIVHTVAQIVH